MHLQTLLAKYAHSPRQSVPEWMLGCFKRHCITFANGLSDTETQVFWLQGRNLTIDLRLPPDREQVHLPPRQCQAQQLRQLANYEGWSADSSWHDNRLSWSGGTSFQLHNRWPEPAILHRVGNCMMEFAPNGAYVEDWRFQANQPGALVSLRLLEERELDSGKCRHRGGALIITGNWAGPVLGRAEADLQLTAGQQLRELVNGSYHAPEYLDALFNFETSIAHGSLSEGYITRHSTVFQRIGKHLCPLDGFDYDAEHRHLTQTLVSGGVNIQRRFAIDSLERDCAFNHASSWTNEAESWFEHEAETLTRYLKAIN